jgi:hypothetical protein
VRYVDFADLALLQPWQAAEAHALAVAQRATSTEDWVLVDTKDF